MRLQSFKVIASMLVAAAITLGCGGGSSAPPPPGLKAVATESTVTVTWDASPGVEYWLFYAPTVYAPKDNSNMSRWFNLLGGNVILNSANPAVVTGLANDASYSFTVNGRTGGGPGGPAATTVTATPRLAGATWTAGTSATAQDLRGLTYSGTYVAVGTGGAILSSTNASTWTSAVSPTTNTLNGATQFATSVVSGSTLTTTLNYLAVGDAGTVLYSNDAVTWTAKTSGTTKNLYAAANNGTLSVAVGAGGTILTSADSTTWTPATASGTTNDLYAVATAGGVWFATGANGTLVKSTDGLTWTAVATGSTVDFHGFAYGTSVTTTSGLAYVLVGNGGTVLTSPDTTTWTAQVLPGASNLNALVFGAQYVTVGNGGKIFTSTDAVTWTAVTSGTTSNLLALVRGTFMYATTGAAGTNLSSK